MAEQKYAGLNTLSSFLGNLRSLFATKDDVKSHTNNKNNPHGMTLVQLGVNTSAEELNYIYGATSNIQTQLNAKAERSYVVDSILRANDWLEGRQIITINGVTSDSNGVIGIAQNITDFEMEAAKNAEFYVCAQGDDTITVAVFGETPKCDIPVVVVLID